MSKPDPVARAASALGVAPEEILASAVRGDVVTLVTTAGQKLVHDPMNPPEEEAAVSGLAAAAEEGAVAQAPAPTEATVKARRGAK